MKISPLTDDERTWLRGQLSYAAEIAGAGQVDVLPSLEALDNFFESFINLGESANPQANAVVLAVGSAFGEHLVRTLGFQWCIVTDDWGTGLAVIARPGQGDVTVFPTDFVAKRWERQEPRFLEASIGQISKSLLDSAADWESNQPGTV